MTKHISPGFFKMEDCHRIFAQTDLALAKQLAHDCVANYVSLHPTTLQENISKATSAIDKCSTVRKLGEMIASFVLAHDSENLKVIR